MNFLLLCRINLPLQSLLHQVAEHEEDSHPKPSLTHPQIIPRAAGADGGSNFHLLVWWLRTVPVHFEIPIYQWVKY